MAADRPRQMRLADLNQVVDILARRDPRGVCYVYLQTPFGVPDFAPKARQLFSLGMSIDDSDSWVLRDA